VGAFPFMNPEDLGRTLGRIEEKIDGVVASHRETKRSISTLYNRTSDLEKHQSRLYGGLAVVVFAIPAVLTALKLWH
jgi:hypothetical protein